MKNRRVTLADVAEKAGKHITTVSLALRNSQRLSAETRESIQKLAKEMGYRPDPRMRALVSYRDRNRDRINPPVLAYVTNWNSRWGWRETTAHPEFYAGAAQAAENLGFNLEHFWMREPGLTHGRLNGILKARGIDGIIIASHVREIDELLKFEWEHFSAVKIDYFPHKPELHVVTNNQLHIVRLAMQQVIRAGYKRIAFIMDRGWDITVDNLWCAGFIWEQQKLAPKDRIAPYLIPEKEPLVDWLQRIRPQVIISKGSFVESILKQLQWRIPEDVAFVDLFNEDTSGNVAGVRQNHFRVGELAVETLASQIQLSIRGIPKIPTTTHVEGTWIEGASLPYLS
ncbi:MAG: LacI family DNA-binding transcriptional regulator [Opitutales bacterium]|nr:LacI family DNA-binding transcriptional regulator [Opitutales bacterium]